jgi:outer membrane protein assembly factor BamE (lipoprotein component of BamABCDE complex)
MALLFGCAYHPNIEQGNLITPAQLEQVKVGDDPSAVRHRLGAPMLIETMKTDVLTYVYSVKLGRHPETLTRYRFYFKAGRLARIDTT